MHPVPRSWTVLNNVAYPSVVALAVSHRSATRIARRASRSHLWTHTEIHLLELLHGLVLLELADQSADGWQSDDSRCGTPEPDPTSPPPGLIDRELPGSPVPGHHVPSPALPRLFVDMDDRGNLGAAAPRRRVFATPTRCTGGVCCGRAEWPPADGTAPGPRDSSYPRWFCPLLSTGGCCELQCGRWTVSAPAVTPL